MYHSLSGVQSLLSRSLQTTVELLRLLHKGIHADFLLDFFTCKMPSGLIFGMAIPFCKWTQHGALEESGGPWEKTMTLSKKGCTCFSVNLRDFFLVCILSAPNPFALEAPVRTLSFTREGFHCDKFNLKS